MKKIFVILLTILAVSLQGYCSQTLDKVIVIVNGETITQSEFDIAYSSMLSRLKGRLTGEELMREAEVSRTDLLDRMIEEKLILSEAKKEDIEVTDAEIQEKVNEVKSKFESNNKFEEALIQEGVSLQELKQRYADQIRVAKLVERDVRKRVVVKPSETLEYYNSHKKDFEEPERSHLKNILIKPGENLSDEDARILAEKILGFLKAGEDFDVLALKYSQGPNPDVGGDMGFIKRGIMLKEIEDAVFKLDPGQLSEVIKTKLGYHIFKVVEKQPDTVRALSEVKDAIEKRLFMEEGKNRYKEWIEGLKKNAYISFR